MTEYFVVTKSFAAPFFSDLGVRYVMAEHPKEALEKVAAEYTHHCGLYSAFCYASADAYHKDEQPLGKWLCNHEIAKRKATAGLVGYSFLGHAPGDFEVNDKRITVENPKGGMVVEVAA